MMIHRISVCIIAKDEADYLRECLSRISKYQFEIVVVDTGSSDNTIEIAREYTNKVYEYKWCNDFSAARNYCISKASNELILSIDCDEHLIDIDISEFEATIDRFDVNSNIGVISLESPYISNGNEMINHTILARFFSKSSFHFEGKIHEQIMPITKGSVITEVKLPIRFFHEGYRNEEIIEKKNERNIGLLEKELESQGGDPYIYYQLGQSYFTLNNYEKAVEYFELALRFDVDTSLEYVKVLVESYGYSLINLKRISKALEFEGIYEEFSNSADFVYLMGLIYMNNAEFDRAVEEFLKATSFSDARVEGVNSYLAYHNIGVIYECTGNIEKAKEYYDRAKK